MENFGLNGYLINTHDFWNFGTPLLPSEKLVMPQQHQELSNRYILVML